MNDLVINENQFKNENPRIAFYGNLTKNCYKYVRYKEVKLTSFAMLLMNLVCCPVIIVIAINFSLILLYGLFIPILLGLSLIIFSLLPKKSYTFLCNIEFYDDDMIITNAHGDSVCRYCSDIDKIIDIGEGYYFVFKFSSRMPLCLCQKDLIQKGTIEEFEEMFARYIVKK